jgi:hypothetical protein
MESKVDRSMMPVPKTKVLHLENRKLMGFLTGRDSIPLSVSGGGRLNPFTSCPVPMTTETLFLVDYGEFARRIFLLQRRLGFIHRARFASASEETADNPANTCLHPRLRPFSHTWLPISLSDPALFYETLSHLSLDILTRHLGEKDLAQSLRYHALAVRSVNSRLSKSCP